jgi:hypothetical protein
MAKIRCYFPDCIYLDGKYCIAAAVEIDPDRGCLTNQPSAETHAEDDWREDEELDEWDEMDEEELEEEESWLDDEEDEF